MKKCFALIIAVCLMLSCFSSLAAAEGTPRWNGFRGLSWGVSSEEIIAVIAAGDDAYFSTLSSTVDGIQYDSLNYYSCVSVSKFDPSQVYLAYLLADNHLYLAGYAIRDCQDPVADSEYLRTALSSLYGAPSESAEKPLFPTVEDMGISGSWVEDFTFWEVDGTVIYEGIYQDAVMVLYYGQEYYTNLMSQPQDQGEINTYGL